MNAMPSPRTASPPPACSSSATRCSTATGSAPSTASRPRRRCRWCGSTREEERLGGAANVAYNVKTLGAQASLLTVVGDDEPARRLEALLARERHRVAVSSATRGLTTIVKLRVIGRSQQLLRIDFENEPDHEVLARMQPTFEQRAAEHDAVLFSDYGKGGLTHIPRMIERRARGRQAGAGRPQGQRLRALRAAPPSSRRTAPSCAGDRRLARARRSCASAPRRLRADARARGAAADPLARKACRCSTPPATLHVPAAGARGVRRHRRRRHRDRDAGGDARRRPRPARGHADRQPRRRHRGRQVRHRDRLLRGAVRQETRHESRRHRRGRHDRQQPRPRPERASASTT